MNPSLQKCIAVKTTPSDDICIVVSPSVGMPGNPQKAAVTNLMIKFIYEYYMIIIRLHCGLSSLQNAPSGVNLHVCVLFPTSSKPSSQVYVTILPSSVSVKFLFPSTGVPGSPQSAKTNQ